MRDASHDQPGGNLEMTFPFLNNCDTVTGWEHGCWWRGGLGEMRKKKKRKALWQICIKLS